MKSTIKLSILTAATAVMLLSGACSSTAYLSSSAKYSDDMYAVHDVATLAREEQRQAEIQRAAEAARLEKLNQMIAAAQSNSEIDDLLKFDDQEDRYVDPYEDILADDYESAYERRLRGFSSPTYRMPSSYYNFRYGSDYFYATAYDPSFYNVMVMGDEVWVEPKYISSMFGTWGRPSVSLSFNFGWPYYSGFYSDYYWNRYYWDWYSPYSYWGWNSPYYDYYWGGWYGPHYGHGPGYGPGPGINHGGFGNSNSVYRPSYGFNRRGNTAGSGVATGRPSSSSSGTVTSTRRTTESYRRSGDSNNSTRSTRSSYDNNSTRTNSEATRSNTTRNYDNNSSTRNNNNNSATRSYDNNSTRSSNSSSMSSSPSRGFSSGSSGGSFSSGGGATRSGGGSTGGRR